MIKIRLSLIEIGKKMALPVPCRQERQKKIGKLSAILRLPLRRCMANIRPEVKNFRSWPLETPTLPTLRQRLEHQEPQERYPQGGRRGKTPMGEPTTSTMWPEPPSGSTLASLKPPTSAVRIMWITAPEFTSAWTTRLQETRRRIPRSLSKSTTCPLKASPRVRRL